MIGLVLVMLAQVDAGSSDAGFQPVIWDVHHGEVYLTDASDAGFNPVALRLPSSVCMDEPTAVWVGQNKATSRGRASVPLQPDMGTILQVALMMFALGAMSAGILVWLFK